MHPLRLAVEQLRPNCNFSDDVTAAEAPWLLGQQRAIQAWQLFSQCDDQHLYVSTIPGFNSDELIRSLQQQWPVATKRYQSTENDYLHDSVTFIGQPLSKKLLVGSFDKNDGYRAGLLASSNVLVVPADSLLDKPSRWNLIKDAIKRGYITVNGKPDRIQVSCKLVIVGDAMSYDALHGYDPEFGDHINLLAEIQPEWFIDKAADAELWGQSAQAVSKRYSNKCLDLSGLKELANYASRLCEHQQRLSLCWHQIGQLLAQTKTLNDAIDAAAINAAIAAQQYRHNSVEVYAQRNVEESLVRVDTSDTKIGQINGLTVVEYLGHSYGEPARITVSVHYGDGEVADIERKSELGGNIHAKGMMILSACLYRIFGQDEPLHLSANIVFEQSYQTIDGDSASLAEYCCLISTIAEVPVKQSLALTGAIDQFGNVQAIGGINEKIEGFFHLCKYRGLTGEQGVILPKANICQLNLSSDVINAVSAGRFHLYYVDNVEHALELMTAEKVGQANDDGAFAADSLYGKVQQRLEHMAGGVETPMPWWKRITAKLLN